MVEIVVSMLLDIGERFLYTQNSLTIVLPVVAGCFLFFTTGFFATAEVETVDATEACGKLKIIDKLFSLSCSYKLI